MKISTKQLKYRKYFDTIVALLEEPPMTRSEALRKTGLTQHLLYKTAEIYNIDLTRVITTNPPIVQKKIGKSKNIEDRIENYIQISKSSDSFAAIGKILGVTRERARMIAVEFGIHAELKKYFQNKRDLEDLIGLYTNNVAISKKRKSNQIQALAYIEECKKDLTRTLVKIWEKACAQNTEVI